MRIIQQLSLTLLCSIIICGNTFTQQPLNLDFEQASMEGIIRPWGWEYSNYSTASVCMDSLSVYHGKYSLRIEDTTEHSYQTLQYNFEPYQLLNSTIKIQGWCKTSLSDGVAFFTLRIVGPDNSLISDTSYQVIKSTGDWQKVEVQLPISENVDFIALQLHHQGKGSSWFDHFKCYKDGVLLKELQVGPSFEEKQLRWLKQQSYPLDHVDAGTPYDDLAFLKDMTSEAQIIALGESTHGTSDFFRLKHRILEYAVYELGVRIFAIEDNQLIIERANKYIMGGEGSARSSMNGMFSVWQNKEVHGLIQWMRDYNDKHPDDKIIFSGFDIQQIDLPLDSLFSYLNRQSPALYQTASGLLHHLRENTNNYYALSDSNKLMIWENASRLYELVNKHSTDWLKAARTKADSLEVIWGEQYAKLVKQYTENGYKGHQSLYRDVAMAENVRWINEKYAPGKRMIIWAHDLHISLGAHPEEMLNYYSGKSMGAHLRKVYGKQYQAFGLWSYTGSYWAQLSYTNFQQMECPLFTAPKGSLEEALHSILTPMNKNVLFLDLSKAASEKWLSRPLPVRFANHVSIDYGFWVRISVPYQFDGIFHVDETSAANSYAKRE